MPRKDPEARKAYDAANKEKRQAYDAANKEKISARKAAYNAVNKEKISARKAKRREPARRLRLLSDFQRMAKRAMRMTDALETQQLFAVLDAR